MIVFSQKQSMVIPKIGIFATDFWQNCHKFVMKTMEIEIK